MSVTMTANSLIEKIFMQQDFFRLLVKVGKCSKSMHRNETSQQFVFLPTTLQTIVAALNMRSVNAVISHTFNTGEIAVSSFADVKITKTEL